MIEFKNLTKLYGSVIGVNDLCLEMEPGAYGLVGPNGSGKTTLINLLTGQLKPTLGGLKVFGQDPWKDRRLLRRIGLCPATDVLYPNVSAKQWVSYLVSLHGFDAAESERLAVESLEIVGMESRMNRPMGEYSLGMRQRAKIAQSIAHQPELIILDEPYNGLDPVGRQQMTRVLKDWVSRGKSLLFASHVLHEIEAITSSFLLVFGGRLLASGTSAQLESFVAEAPQEVTLVGEGVASILTELAQQDWVDSVQLMNHRTQLRIALRNPAAFYGFLPNWIAKHSIQVEQLQASEGNLTAIFEALLKYHRGDVS